MEEQKTPKWTACQEEAKKRECTVCKVAITDENHYDTCKSRCKKCYIDRVKQSPAYLARHTPQRGMNKFTTEELDRVYVLLKLKTISFRKAAKEYGVNPTTLHAWFNRQEHRPGLCVLKIE